MGCPVLFGVLEENWPVVDAFLSVRTQWRVGVGGAVGLDYVGVKAALEALQTRLTRELFTGLQVMEGAVLELLAERQR